MGLATHIQWTDHTFNPWIGCDKVSPACAHCYAETWSKRYGRAEWGEGKPRQLTKTWGDPVKWNREAAALGARRRVFCASLADVFDEEVPVEWRARLWDLIASTPALDWQLLTKRPENFSGFLPWSGEPWPNVWLGVTAENQAMAEKRLPILTVTAAAVRFISAEPLLGPLDLSPWLDRVDWVIVGGESGAGARVMREEWATSVLEQCVSSGTAAFFKQKGEVLARMMMCRDRKGGDFAEFPSAFQVREFPRAA